jgi:hypothetical protein
VTLLTMRRTVAALATVATALALAVALAPTAEARPHAKPLLAPAAADALTRALAAGRLTEAEYALERARSLFDLAGVRTRFGPVKRAAPRSATLYLRDLALRLTQLSGAERRAAAGLLARPVDPSDPDGYHRGTTVQEDCDPQVCVHWVESTTDKAPAGWPETTRKVFDDVWRQEVDGFGYREPLRDGDSDADPRFDVYLVDLAADGLFGYCTSDDPDRHLASRGGPYDVSAYCVVDNDFADGVYAPLTPLEALAVTAAHEFFHAVQYAYDWTEDTWFLESMAAWIEDELADSGAVTYDGVNDNVGFLATSPLTYPHVPLDGAPAGRDSFRYGGWIFWRFISERMLGRDAVRGVLTRADGSAVSLARGRDEFSAQALARYLARHGTSLRAAYVRFAIANRRRTYTEWREAGYPGTRTTAGFRVRPAKRSTGWQAVALRHLSSRYYSIRPGRGTPRRARLRVKLDLPVIRRGSAAAVITVLRNGRRPVRTVALDSRGNGGMTVAFGRRSVRRIDVVLTNGSARYDLSTCWTGETSYSCGGAVARDDARVFRFRAKLR